MRALLLETDPSYAQLVSAVFALEGVQLHVVRAEGEFAQVAHLFNALFLDASGGQDADLSQCLRIIKHVARPVYIFHPREDAIQQLKALVGLDVTWIPADFRVLTMRDRVHLLSQASAATSAPRQRAVTEREQEVHQLIADGYSTSEIAKALHLSPSTVKTYSQRLKKKLDVGSRRELVQVYTRTRGGLHAVHSDVADVRATPKTTRDQNG